MDRDQLHEPQLLAAIDAIGRANASEFEVGYLDDSEDSRDARWWATARWRGVRVTVEDHPTPGLAAEALARRLLEGGTCTHCGRRIALTLGWCPNPHEGPCSSCGGVGTLESMCEHQDELAAIESEQPGQRP